MSYTHDVRVLAGLDNLVAINSVLDGRPLRARPTPRCSTAARSAAPAGCWTSCAARGSLAGRPLDPGPAGDRGGRQGLAHRRPRLGARDVVSCPRADADIVVTEHGIARLRDLPLDERARALIGMPRRSSARRWRANGRGLSARP